MAKNSSGDFVGMMEEWFSKAPALPANARETLAKIAPIIALIFGILGVIFSLGGLGALIGFSPLAALGGAQMMGSYSTGMIAAVFWLVSSVLMLVAYPGLKARKLGGWNMLFWSEVVSLVGSLVSLSIVSGIIGALIGFYLLFQIKSHYK